MPKGYIVKLPMGMGKTRIVLSHILRGTPNSIAAWNTRLKRTIILAPNDRVKRAWLRELLLLAAYKKLIKNCDEAEIRLKGTRGLENILDEAELSVPTFMTYRTAWKKRKPLKDAHCHYLIIDEWHSLPDRVRYECQEFIKDGKTAKWFIGGRNIRKKIYFVSATPINPVRLEQERDFEEEDATDEFFRERVFSLFEEAVDVIQAFLGIRETTRDGKFLDIIYAMGVKEIKKYGNKTLRYHLPLDVASASDQYFDDKDLVNIELPAIKLFMDDCLFQPGNGNRAISREYAYCVGLIRTRQHERYGPHFICLSRKGAKQCCFGEPYQVLHYPPELGKKRKKASKWLYENHTRMKRLLNVLIGEGIITEAKNGDLVLTQKKVLVFCTHTAEAIGLTKGLTELLTTADSHSRDGFHEIASNIHLNKDKIDDLQTAFNTRNRPPYILVATDAFSESIDLHEECKLIIHYELPWSPLRLFQRIGRLTRLKTWGNRVLFNKNVRVGHIVIPGSVEEERINRLIRRIEFLSMENLWPEGYNDTRLISGLIGSGPSLHYNEYMTRVK